MDVNDRQDVNTKRGQKHDVHLIAPKSSLKLKWAIWSEKLSVFAVKPAIPSLLAIFTTCDWRICPCVHIFVDSNLILLIARKSTQPLGQSI
jgi:hypothetical protein